MVIDLVQLLNDLYREEIPCGIASSLGGGWTIWVGGGTNQRRAEEYANRAEEIAGRLEALACREYPLYAEKQRKKAKRKARLHGI